MSTSGREAAKIDFYNAHNDYVLQFRASNCLVEKVEDVLPAVLEELEEIHIDTCNTIKAAIESHALVLLNKATERHRRFDDLLKVCHQVNPQLDVSYFIRSMSQDVLSLQQQPYQFNYPADINAELMELESVRDQLIIDRHTESTIRSRRQAVQKEASELTSYIKQNQDVTQTLVNMCQSPSPEVKDIQPPDSPSSVSSRTTIESPQRTYSSKQSLERRTSISSSFKIFRSFSREVSTDAESETSSHRKVRSNSAKRLDFISQEMQLQRRLRNLANHLYAKVYETQEDMCRKRNEIRLANIQLAAVRAQIEVLSPKHNGAVEGTDQESKKAHSSASIKGMWKKAVKSLKSNSGEPKPTRLSKKGSLIKRKDSKEVPDTEGPEESQEIDPVYSLLKCAADLPKTNRSCTHTHCTGHHARHSQGDTACGNTSKNSSPSSSEAPTSKQKEKFPRKKDEVVHSPKSRRKKLNSRMKSFSLDTPDPPKQLLAIDETTKKKSSSFSNTYLGVHHAGFRLQPLDPAQRSSAFIRHKLGGRSSSLEIDESKSGASSFSLYSNPSPVSSNPNLSQLKSSKKKNDDVYVVLYNFKAKEKDDLDLRAGWRISVLESSKKDWWKGKCNGKVGHFPAAYVERLQPGQRIFQVTSPVHITEGAVDVRFHKDQIVLQVGEELNGSILVKSMNNRQANCPLKYLLEV
ncbi:uncharacterized protein LOC106875793 isoform X2 [Octopus bimaculoides]|uniref:uncharacterized protein LOC106875793 isoform X2 n=1 Tax=Octopus bimaculoides TaxID=37653 RepID=UPI0022E35B43|nr:uncharacterized protein LOC106875793 isoform X2 [Octopus bimaculoides]